mgnify:FL=1
MGLERKRLDQNYGLLMEVSTMSESVKNYKKEAISIARDFHYSTSILARLNNATTEGEICRLMIEGRHTKRYY